MIPAEGIHKSGSERRSHEFGYEKRFNGVPCGHPLRTRAVLGIGDDDPAHGRAGQSRARARRPSRLGRGLRGSRAILDELFRVEKAMFMDAWDQTLQRHYEQTKMILEDARVA